MSREDAIKVEGLIVEVLKANLFRVELANRHRLVAHVAAKARSTQLRFSPGDKVTVEMSPYDLSKGRITAEKSF
ncbi:MAG: translation initiation factor IF-1 [Verrucomicrobia bacterium]|nr:MAG: translation initiation factor IF-1 [Verrucomicrobiota bacterium]